MIIRVQRGQECVVRDRDGPRLVAEDRELFVRPPDLARIDIPVPTPQMSEGLGVNEMASLLCQFFFRPLFVRYVSSDSGDTDRFAVMILE